MASGVRERDSGDSGRGTADNLVDVSVAEGAVEAGKREKEARTISHRHFEVEMEGISSAAVLTVQAYPLILRSAFGTSHSSTTRRSNVIIGFRAVSEAERQASQSKRLLQEGEEENGCWGYGEVGLPPKKRGVYFADSDDVFRFVERYADCWQGTASAADDGAFRSTLTAQQANIYSHALAIERSYGGGCGAAAPAASKHDSRRKQQVGNDSCAHNSIRPSTYALALALLDFHPLHRLEPDMSRAAASGVETAILDAWARDQGIPIFQLLRLPPPSSSSSSPFSPKGPRPSFCTASLNDDVRLMCEEAKGHRAFSPFLKIKLDADVGRGRRVLEALLRQRQQWHVEELEQQKQEISNEKKKKKTTTTKKKAVVPHKKNVLIPCDYVERWCIDANGSWTPAIALQFLSVIQDLFPFSEALDASSSSRSSSYYSSSSSCASGRGRAAAYNVHLWMVEQPFPADILHAHKATTCSPTESSTSRYDRERLSSNNDPYDLDAWAHVRRLFWAQGVQIFADESMHTVADIPRLLRTKLSSGEDKICRREKKESSSEREELDQAKRKKKIEKSHETNKILSGGPSCPSSSSAPLSSCASLSSSPLRPASSEDHRFVDGVVLKVEKAGGLRALAKAARVADAAGLRVWVGIMVVSALGCSTCAQLLGVASECDLDGLLIVDASSERFEPGFRFGKQEGEPFGHVLVTNDCAMEEAEDGDVGGRGKEVIASRRRCCEWGHGASLKR